MFSIRCIVLLSVLLLSVIPTHAQSRLDFPATGFSIAPLEVTPGDVGYTALSMSLPATDGFAPNVNVQIQQFDGSLDDYIALSRQQFDAYEMEILREDRDGVTVTWEFTWTMQGQELHGYSRAHHAEGKVFLVTGTAAASQWESVSRRLKSSVDSFTLDEHE